MNKSKHFTFKEGFIIQINCIHKKRLRVSNFSLNKINVNLFKNSKIIMTFLMRITIVIIKIDNKPLL